MYPATKTVHWPTGPADCCDEHAKQLVALGKFLGSHVGVTEAVPGAQCKNCNGEWDTYMEYTSALTNLRDLRLGWLTNAQ